MEIKTELKTYSVEYECDDCNKGKMKFTGMTLTSNPPWYVHKCSNCGIEQNFRRSYPTVIHREDGE